MDDIEMPELDRELAKQILWIIATAIIAVALVVIGVYAYV